MNDLKNAFTAYTSKPFLFMWASILYVFFVIVFVLSAIGIGLIALMLSFLFNYQFSIQSPVTMLFIGLLFLYYLYFTGGVTAALIRSYKNGITGTKTNMIEFYRYALSRAPQVFWVTLMRDIFTAALVLPAIGVYYYYLKDYEYTEIIVALYSLFILFILRMLAKPMVIAAGGEGDNLFDAFRRAFFVIKTKHIYFLGTFIIYSVAWLMNFIPIIQFVSLFFLYPVSYSALILMVDSTRQGDSDGQSVRSGTGKKK